MKTLNYLVAGMIGAGSLKNILTNLLIGIKIGVPVGLAFSVPMMIHAYESTYKFAESQIWEYEKCAGQEHTIMLCEDILKNSYKHFILFRLIDGADNAAKEYLQSNKLNKK